MKTFEDKVEFDSALNDAGWALFRELTKYGKVSGHMFNNLKPALKVAIECYMSESSKAKPIPQTKEVEWVNGLPPVGVECEVRFRTDGDWTDWFSKGKFKAGYDSKIWFSHELGDCVYPAHDIEFRKPETEAERVERERLENGEAMYIQHCKNLGSDKFYWDEKNSASKEAWCKLAEQYRKESE